MRCELFELWLRRHWSLASSSYFQIKKHLCK